jgi:hypothetical protein
LRKIEYFLAATSNQQPATSNLQLEHSDIRVHAVPGQQPATK